ncbi:hypothetical protein ACS0TY_024815 [Phlomoides rotata]
MVIECVEGRLKFHTYFSLMTACGFVVLLRLSVVGLSSFLIIMSWSQARPLIIKKIGVMFSVNVNSERRAELCGILGVHGGLNTGHYLGLPSLVEQNKREILSYIKERMWRWLQGWKGRKLSKAGKEIMIKATAQAIPTYCMSTFLLPSTLLDELHVMLNKFWWGSNSDSSKGVKWLRWEKICVMKEVGGRGFRDLHMFNIALLGKLAWWLVNDSSSLVCKLFKARYFPSGDFCSATLGRNPSFTWSSIHASQDLLRLGVRWKIGCD